MARLLFPDEGSRLVYRVNGAALAAAPGLAVAFYNEAGATSLADIRAYDGTATPGAVITGSTVAADGFSRIPFFWGPDGVDTIYASTPNGPVSLVYARTDDRLDALGVRVTAIETGEAAGEVLSVDGRQGVVTLSDRYDAFGAAATVATNLTAETTARTSGDSTNATAAAAAQTTANAAYVKPGSGIPSTDMTAAVIASLGKADVAVPKGTLVLYAVDYGAVGDNATDSTAAIQAAITAAYSYVVANGGGAVVQLGPGVFRTTSALTLPRNVTLQGSHNPMWVYDVGNPSTIKPRSTFNPATNGAACIVMNDETLGGYSSAVIAGTTYAFQGGQVIKDLVLDGSAYTATAIDGVASNGQVVSARLENVTANRFSGHGFVTYTATESTVLVYAKGWRVKECVAGFNAGDGFRFNNLTDSLVSDSWAVANTGTGFNFNVFGEVTFSDCHSVFNTGHGLLLQGQSGGMNIPSFNTDRNNLNGILVSCSSGPYPIAIGTLALRRDGSNGNAGGGGYAGLNVTSTTTPVVVANITTSIGLDDGAVGGSPSPQYGASTAVNTTLVISSGYLWGVTAAINGPSYSNPAVGTSVWQANGGTGVYGSGPSAVTGGGLQSAASVPGTPSQGGTPLVGNPWYGRKQIAVINNNGSTTAYTITHNLGTSNVVVAGKTSTGAQLNQVTGAGITNYTYSVTGTTVVITYGTAPTAARVDTFTIVG